ncbi:DUF4832 domain-containing protein [Arthrobacter sp. ZBG10]|uniref:DUF4832 domain-containing protein n=1 Tax=Arthrobacter sp. ZBG10 TaxID=1676590 RepID=UPI001E342BF8|nr:DUF4832 domain-containing protein [Arthrobacter sp. ZBG10]
MNTQKNQRWLKLPRRRLSVGAVVSGLVAFMLLVVPSASTVPAAEAAATSGDWVPLAAGPAPASSPLAGFVPFAGAYSSMPHSMEWFYLPVNAVVTGPGTFNWASLETQLNAIAGRGHQAVFRFYLDYPGKATGIPAYLLQSGLSTHRYADHQNRGVSVSPDYEDPRLVSALEGFVAAFGARYDGDPRIGFIQMGLLGFWGEWHTFPHDGWGSPENWFASTATQGRVLASYTKAFRKTKLQVRYPDAANKSLNVGYHDDSFAVQTLPGIGWHFVDKLRQSGTTGKWLTQPVGGELRVEIQDCIFETPMRCPVIESGADNDFSGSVAATHASWLLNHRAFSPGYTGQTLANAKAASQSLGYRFQATAFALTRGAVSGQSDLTVKVNNAGVAPFYYDWPIQVAAADSGGKIVRTWTTSWKLSGVKPGTPVQWKTTVGGVPPGYYTLLMRPVNPLATGVPLRFANASQDKTLAGWLTLGRKYLPAP